MKQGQAQRLHELLKDGRPHRTDNILENVYGNSHAGIARIGARIHDIKSRLPEGWTIKSWRDPERPSLWFYQLQQTAPVEHTPTTLFA